MELYDRIVDKNLPVQRIYVTVNNVINENEVKTQNNFEQLDFFTDYAAPEKEREAEKALLEREKICRKQCLI